MNVVSAPRTVAWTPNESIRTAAGRRRSSSRMPARSGRPWLRFAGAGRAAAATVTRTTSAAAMTPPAAAIAAAGAGPDEATTRPVISGPANVPRLSPSAPAVFAATRSSGRVATDGRSARVVGPDEGTGGRGARDGEVHDDRLVHDDRGGDDRGPGGPQEVDRHQHALRAWRAGRVDEDVDDHRRQHPEQRHEADGDGPAGVIRDDERHDEDRPVHADAHRPRQLERADVGVAQDARQRPDGDRDARGLGGRGRVVGLGRRRGGGRRDGIVPHERQRYRVAVGFASVRCAPRPAACGAGQLAAAIRSSTASGPVWATASSAQA